MVLGATVNAPFKTSISSYSLLVYRNTIGFCISTLYSETLLPS